MSRVYRALEKAEKEKQEKSKKEFFFETFEEKGVSSDERSVFKEERSISKKEESSLTYQPERTVVLGPPPREEGFVLVAPPNSFAEEQFRKLRTHIFHWSSNPPHTILVTSAVPGEGKTMVASNLAMIISQEIQKKAILVDADLRKPSIHLESHRHSKGLSGYLLGQAHLSEILVNSGMENLWVVPAGPSPKKSAELIGTKKMKELLTSLREFGNDTYVVIDSSPIFSTSEPTLLSKMVEGVVLVVMADRTPRESTRRAIQSIDRQKIMGVVFNQKELKPMGHYYSSYYYRSFLLNLLLRV